MTEAGAERAITTSALIVIGIYAYRRMTEGASSAPAPGVSKLGQLAGEGPPASIGTFITAWGFTFLVLSIVASAAPGLGGSFAILVAVADALGNTSQIADDVNSKLTAKGVAVQSTAQAVKAEQRRAAAQGELPGLVPVPSSLLPPLPAGQGTR